MHGRIRLVLDIKGDDAPDAYYGDLEHTHQRMCRGGAQIKSFFKGKLKLSDYGQDLRRAVSRG